MNVDDAVVQVKAMLGGSYLVKKHQVFDDLEAKRPTVVVKMFCVNIVKDVSELTTLIRKVRQRIPKAYSVSFNIKTVM